MKKFIFDLNAEAWIRGIEIEAETAEDAMEKLYDMTLSDLIDNGYVKQSEISDIDYEVEEEED